MRIVLHMHGAVMGKVWMTLGCRSCKGLEGGMCGPCRVVPLMMRAPTGSAYSCRRPLPNARVFPCQKCALPFKTAHDIYRLRISCGATVLSPHGRAPFHRAQQINWSTSGASCTSMEKCVCACHVRRQTQRRLVDHVTCRISHSEHGVSHVHALPTPGRY